MRTLKTLCLLGAILLAATATRLAAQNLPNLADAPDHAHDDEASHTTNEPFAPCDMPLDLTSNGRAPTRTFESFLAFWAFGFDARTNPRPVLAFDPSGPRRDGPEVAIIEAYRSQAQATPAQQASGDFDAFPLPTLLTVSTLHMGTPPATPFYPNMEGFTTHEQNQVKAAYDQAYQFVWYARELLEYMNANYSEWEAKMWSDGYKANLNDVQNGKSVNPGTSNWSPRAWFGVYDAGRFNVLRQVVNQLWARFNHKAIFFKRKAGTNGYYGYHYEPGQVNLCNRFFTDFANGWDAYATSVEQGRRIIHEYAHWIETTEGWVADGHDIKKPNSIIRAHGIAHKWYGTSDAKHLADVHPGFAVRNNDNIAIWIMRLGVEIMYGSLKQFPPNGLGGYKPPTKPKPKNPDIPGGCGLLPAPPQNNWVRKMQQCMMQEQAPLFIGY